MYEVEKQELVDICHLLYKRNLVTATDGNVSLRVSDEHIILTGSAVNKGMITKDQILVLDLEGNTVEGQGRASKEYPMHKIIYLKRADVASVVHTHPVYATAFALAGRNIPKDHLIETSMMLQGTAIAGYATPGTVEMADVVEPYLREHDTILLKNHGAVTYGRNLVDAFNKMEVLESIAKTIIMSRILGEPQLITKEQLEKIKK